MILTTLFRPILELESNIHDTKKLFKSFIKSPIVRTTAWGDIKNEAKVSSSIVTKQTYEQIKQNEAIARKRPWGAKKVPNYVTEYTWLPQPMVQAAANDLVVIEESSEDESIVREKEKRNKELKKRARILHKIKDVKSLKDLRDAKQELFRAWQPPPIEHPYPFVV